MLHLPRKVLAILLAVWLPLFSGYALAESVTMQNMRGDCRGAEQVAQHDATSQQHMHHSKSADDQTTGTQHDNSCSNSCGVCQIACGGYVAAFAADMALIDPSAQSFIILSTQFQSVTSAPLDPPPLARV